jgi:hypothetical protein
MREHPHGALACPDATMTTIAMRTNDREALYEVALALTQCPMRLIGAAGFCDASYVTRFDRTNDAATFHARGFFVAQSFELQRSSDRFAAV